MQVINSVVFIVPIDWSIAINSEIGQNIFSFHVLHSAAYIELFFFEGPYKLPSYSNLIVTLLGGFIECF